MRTLQKSEELSIPRNAEHPSLLLVASTKCHWCTVFHPVYRSIAESVNSYCQTYMITAEEVGGRKHLQQVFVDYFGERHPGFPTLYIVDNGLTRVDPDIMWDPDLEQFDKEAIIAYLINYLMDTGG